MNAVERSLAAADGGGAAGGRPERAPVPAPKITAPEPVAHLVARQRVIDLLDCDSPVVLVRAPAGYGKTSLLAAWAVEGAPQCCGATAWVQVDSDDAEPFRLWSAILAALQGAAGPMIAGIGQLSPPRGRMEPGFLAAFIDAIDRGPGRICLVLDDVHRVGAGPAAASVDMLLAQLPGKLRLILASRLDPPLDALRRLRLAGQLREIRSDVLVFDRAEAAALLAAHGIALGDSDLDLMMARTEGWPAGLRLAGIALSNAADRRSALAEFLAGDRNVADYLSGEVLVHLPAAVHRFLLAISVCEQVSIGLAEALSGQPAAAMLDRLEHADALVVRIAGHYDWYRLHALFRQYLYVQLRRDGAAERVHQAAAAWFEAHDEPGVALEHAVAGNDPELLTGMIERHLPHLMLAGEEGRLRRLLTTIAPAVLNDPWVALADAWTALEMGDVPTADRHIARLKRQPETTTPGRGRAMLALFRLRRSLLTGEAAPAAYEAALACGEDCDDPDVDLLLLAGRGVAATLIGQLPEAQRDLRRASQLAARGGHDSLQLYCLSCLAAVECVRDDFGQAGEAAATAIGFATARGWARSPRVATAYMTAAWAAWQRCDLDTAARFAPLAVDLLGEGASAGTRLAARCVEAAVRFDRSEQRQALRDWRAAWREYDDASQPSTAVARLMPVQAAMALALGEQGAVAEAIERLAAMPGGEGDVAVLRATLSARRGRADHARRLLRPVLDGETALLFPTTLTQAWLLEAVLADAVGEDEHAGHAVAAAVELAAPRQDYRSFLAAGEQLRDLLARHAGQLDNHEGFVAVALALHPPVSALPEPLTARERQLLKELPSMRTVKQLAAHLNLAPSTVKTHLRGIYRKLGVAARREAVIEARRRGYL